MSSGVVSLWSQAQVENWSAFAPDFKELDENVEYEERESEFDLEDEDRSPARISNDNNDDENFNVDVVTPHSIIQFLSRYFNFLKILTPILIEILIPILIQIISNLFIYLSDEEEEDHSALIFLPIAPEIDDPEVEGPVIPSPQPETPTKSKRIKTVDIDLKEAPRDGNLNLILTNFRRNN